MKKRLAITLYLNVALILATSLLGLVGNYLTSLDDPPGYLRALRSFAFPAFLIIVVALIGGQIVLHNVSNPKIARNVWDSTRPPYPGLEPFRENDAAVFFGRDQLIKDIVKRVITAPANPQDRMIVVVGASGSGKSSLVQAGVVPLLKTRRVITLPAFSPGSDPVGNLAQMISAESDDTRNPGAVVRALRKSPAELQRYLGEMRRSRGHIFSHAVLVFDQLEELLTICGESDRELFLAMVAEALRSDARISIIASMRIEFLAQFLTTRQPSLFQNPLAIGAIQSEYLTTVIEEPGRIAGMSFAAKVVDRIAADVGTTDALPLLAYLLQELFFDVGPRGTVTLDAYMSAGGVGGALARQADQAVNELRASDGIAPILAVLLRFVSVDGSEVAKRPVPLLELDAVQRRIVDAFVDARLLVTKVRDGQAYAEVAHEALFRLWAPLRQEVETRAEQLRLRSELERWASDWEHSGRSHDYLLTGDRLILAERWLVGLESFGQASDSVRALIDYSKRRDVAFLRRVSENIGQYVLGNAERFPELSILLSIAALAEAPRTPVIERALMSALAFSHVRAVLAKHADTVRAIAWAPDGQHLATASRDATARVFDAATGREVAVLTGHNAMVEAIAWAPDSRRLATCGRDRTVKIWRLGATEPQRTLYGAEDLLRGVAWSPDGERVAAGSQDHNVHIWRADDGEHIQVLTGHTGDVYSLGWSPSGAELASVSHDRSAIVWNLADGTIRARLTGHTDFLEALSWSPDGRRLATGSGDQTVRLWDVAEGRQLLLIRGHSDMVWSVAWSPDGRSVASSSSDKTIRVWDVEDARELATLRGHEDAVWGAVWSPNGTELASASSDRTARIWAMIPQGAEELAYLGHDGGLRSVAWAASGTQFATGSDDGTLRVWDVASATEVYVRRHRDVVWGVAWSPDGSRLASCSNDGTVRLWQLAAEESVFTLDEQTVCEGIAWSPDGSRLATACRDGTASIWDAENGRRLTKLRGHTDWVVRVAWSPSGRMVATTSDDRTARIWDTFTGEEIVVLRGHQNWADGVAWSPDERVVATCSADWTARLWDWRTGSQIATLTGHEGRVRTIAWSPDGDLIVTGSYDRTVRVWNAADGSQVRVAGVHTDRVTAVAWSTDGRSLLSASMDRSARLWAVEPDFDALRRRATARVFRDLTADERQSHLLARED